MTTGHDRHETLRIRLLGGMSLSIDDTVLPPLPRHARLLLAALLLERGRPQPRSVLVGRLWPELSEHKARRRLSQALWQAQDLLKDQSPHVYIRTPGDTVAFDTTAPYWLDVEEFEQRLDTVQGPGVPDSPGLRILREAVELYRGDLLPGVYDQWFLDRQEHLRQLHMTALELLMEGHNQRGDYHEALRVGLLLTMHEPLREDVHRQVMRIATLLGQTTRALEQYERCREALAEQLGAEPARETTLLWQQITRRRHAEDGAAATSFAGQMDARRLVGRRAERALLIDQLERVHGGSSGFVFVEGEPGVGKSHLLERAADDARWRDLTIARGACEGSSTPLAAIREALAPVLDASRVEQLRAQVEPIWLREAARLLPIDPAVGAVASAGTRPGQEAADQDGAARMRQALTSVIVGLARINPLVLVVEDVHWADADTFELLAALAGHSDPGPVLVVLSFRDLDARADPAVWGALKRIDRDADPTRILLEPLSLFETGRLLSEVMAAPSVPANFTTSVHAQSGGNPLYVLEILRGLRDEGALAQGQKDDLDRVDVPVTDDLRAVIGRRLDLLSSSASDLATLGAVLGDSFYLATVSAAGVVEDNDLTRALRELTERNVVRYDTEEGAYRFTHAASRHVALERIPGGGTLHLVAAEALEATRPDDVETLARLFQQAGEPARAFAHVRRAADRAVAVHAYGTAADHLRDAVRIAQDMVLSVDEHKALLLQAEQVFGVIANRSEQGEMLQRLEELGGVDFEVRLRHIVHLGGTDDVAGAVRLADETVAVVPADQPAVRGRLLTALGQVHQWAGHHDRSVTALTEAVELIGEEPRVALPTQLALGEALRFINRFDGAEQAMWDALKLAEELDDDAGRVHALTGLAAIKGQTGHYDQARQLLDDTIEVARRIGFKQREGSALLNRAVIEMVQLDIGASFRSLGMAVEALESARDIRGLGIALSNRAWLLVRWVHDPAAAEQGALRAVRSFEEIGAGSAQSNARGVLATVARGRGDHRAARAQLEIARRVARDASDAHSLVQVLHNQTELELETGQVDEARRAAAEGLGMARDMPTDEFTAELAALAAVAAVAAGDTAAANDLAAEAAEHLEETYEPARVHYRLGVVAEADGRSDQAAEHFVIAHDLTEKAIGSLPEELRGSAAQVPLHGAIEEAFARHQQPVVQLVVARADAPRGRPLTEDETVPVTLALPPPPASAEDRRRQVLHVVDQVRDHHAEMTLADLRDLFGVSLSTIRRDLRTLRAQGHDATTRGTGVG